MRHYWLLKLRQHVRQGGDVLHEQEGMSLVNCFAYGSDPIPGVYFPCS